MKPIRKGRPRRKPARHAYPIDDAWRAEIRKIMKERGLSQAGLAALIGASPPAIVLLFKPDTAVSTLVPAIHDAFGLIPPGATQVIRAA
jgi:hypothetical protein